jgi:hypothetical protein
MGSEEKWHMPSDCNNDVCEHPSNIFLIVQQQGKKCRVRKKNTIVESDITKSPRKLISIQHNSMTIQGPLWFFHCIQSALVPSHRSFSQGRF